mmetsp:Transcript_18575/g.60557  ORF Transcript_18575/g.60557 Transcript_18575/m.60557 type:complete len:83 (+) Transcript_18575:45-293(+)
MLNDAGESVDLYIPRKCSWTNRLLQSTDNGSTQINIGHLDEHGVYTGNYTTFALSGYVRNMGEGDSALDLLWQKKKGTVGQI